MTSDLFVSFLDLMNETLAAAIVIVATSLLLYTITRNAHDRVARASAMVLFAVTTAYVCDVLTGLRPTDEAVLRLLRAQWLGIALAPAALVHLSDALLDTTGLPSRGRRSRTLRLMYLIGTAFVIAAMFSDILVGPIESAGRPALRAMPLMAVFAAYTVVASGFALINVERARRRCLTRSTRRRMGYLEIALLTPIVGVFPFSAFFAPGGEFTTGALVLVIIANIFVVLMLLFLAYPLSFFGSRIPDRAVKADLLRMVLRGPATGMLIVAVLFFTSRATRIFGLVSSEFAVFAVVTVVLCWQWIIDLMLPLLDRWLIYGEESEQFNKIQKLNRQLLTRADLLSLMEGILAQARNVLRTSGAFVAALTDSTPEVISATGRGHDIEDRASDLSGALGGLKIATVAQPLLWEGFWLLPLSRQRGLINGGQMIGVLGLQATHDSAPTADEMAVIARVRRRVARALDDMLLQSEVVAALEGLLPQFATSRESNREDEYQPRSTPAAEPNLPALPDRDQIVEQVQAALRHYYGGPGMTKSRLLDLAVVRRALEFNVNEPVRALRSVLDRAIELQRPPGERDWRSQDWLIYNILDLRYIKKQRVREVANRLYMSDANLYRKQNLAIEAVADSLLRMEADALLEEATESESKSVL
ncbi:MAG: hypothetical protein J5J04_02435 [Anaerolineae bacterium]|nr:hypothetical protein [Anaerolineae bacterium]OQY83473.1 MAG: hypothetical protein B6D42_07525 [Anaerolineae bacterium UTCFX5]